MNITSTQPVAATPHYETPRPVQPQTQETSRPVIAPTHTEAMAQEARRGEERPDGHASRAETAGRAAESHVQTTAAPVKTGQDPLIGAILDVFA